MDIKEQNYEEFFKQVNQKQFDELMYQYRLLQEWMDKTYPEINFRVDMNMNNISKQLEITVSCLTHNAMVKDNRLFVKNTLVIRENEWYNTVYVEKLLKSIVPGYQKSINKAVNEWYAKEKERVDAGVSVRGT